MRKKPSKLLKVFKVLMFFCSGLLEQLRKVLGQRATGSKLEITKMLKDDRTKKHEHLEHLRRLLSIFVNVLAAISAHEVIA